MLNQTKSDLKINYMQLSYRLLVIQFELLISNIAIL